MSDKSANDDASMRVTRSSSWTKTMLVQTRYTGGSHRHASGHSRSQDSGPQAVLPGIPASSVSGGASQTGTRSGSSNLAPGSWHRSVYSGVSTTAPARRAATRDLASSRVAAARRTSRVRRDPYVRAQIYLDCATMPTAPQQNRSGKNPCRSVSYLPSHRHSLHCRSLRHLAPAAQYLWRFRKHGTPADTDVTASPAALSPERLVGRHSFPAILHPPHLPHPHRPLGPPPSPRGLHRRRVAPRRGHRLPIQPSQARQPARGSTHGIGTPRTERP